MFDIIGTIKIKTVIRYSMYYFGRTGNLADKTLNVVTIRNNNWYVCVDDKNNLIDIDKRDVVKYKEFVPNIGKY